MTKVEGTIPNLNPCFLRRKKRSTSSRYAKKLSSKPPTFSKTSLLIKRQAAVRPSIMLLVTGCGLLVINLTLPMGRTW